MQSETTIPDTPPAPEKDARQVQPFMFLSGSHPEPSETFSEFVARRNSASKGTHPSFASDVPSEDDDD